MECSALRTSLAFFISKKLATDWGWINAPESMGTELLPNRNRRARFPLPLRRAGGVLACVAVEN